MTRHRWAVAAAAAVVGVVATGAAAAATSYTALRPGSAARITCPYSLTKTAATPRNWTVRCPSPSPTTTTTTATATATPPPTATPTTDPVSRPTTTGYPDAATTGVPAGVTLATYTGPCNIPAGTTIDAATIDCATRGAFVRIMGPGVTITRSHVIGAIRSLPNEGGAGSTVSATISDSDLDGGQQETFPTVSYDGITLLRDDVTGGQHSVQCITDCTIRDSYLHGQYLPPTSAGHVNAFISNGGGDYTIDHSTLWCSVTQTANDGGCSGDASLFGDFGDIANVHITNNLFHSTGGSFCLFAGQEASKSGRVTQVTITGNVFQRGGNSKCGYYGPVTSVGTASQGYVVNGNTYDDGSSI